MTDDRLKSWEYEEQTKVKHKVVITYLNKWFTILGKENKLNYIDGFCGLGLYKDEKGNIHPGSPVLAIFNYEKIHKPKGKEIKFLFIDTEQENLSNIKQYLKKEKVQTKPIYVLGEFDNVINTVLNKIPNLAPTFVLIDPFGCKGVKINTIKRIMKRDKTEIVLNFMYTRVNEFLSAPNFKQILQDYFGPCNWRVITRLKGFAREKAIISLYRNQLKQYCGIKYIYPYPIEFPHKRRTYYYLFHLTNYWLGCSIMKSVFSSLNYRRLAYLGNRSNQLSLLDIDSVKQSEIERYFIKKYKRQSMSYIDLIKREIDEISYTEGDFKRCLKEMETKGVVEVRRVTSKTPRGLRGDDIIIF